MKCDTLHPSDVLGLTLNLFFDAGFVHRLFSLFGSERGTFPGAIVQFSYVELDQATNKFSSANLIGIGGSSNVYRGHLKDGRVVAVKRLRSLGWPEADSEFLSEVFLKCSYHFSNLLYV